MVNIIADIDEERLIRREYRNNILPSKLTIFLALLFYFRLLGAGEYPKRRQIK